MGCAAENSVQVQLLAHFGLRENPFGVTPDPRFLFFSQTHREALASLINGIDCGFGFQVLVAQPGMGKTTLLFNFLERFRTTAHTAFLFQPRLEPFELLQSVLFELEAGSEETSMRKLSEQLNQVLGRAARENKRVIVVVDEAQNLEFGVLETLRQLSNFETSHTKLMQIVLAGQPQLAMKLASPDQEQLRQRISTIGRLGPLELNETHAYINHRLGTAGYRGGNLFTPGAVHNIWNHSKGIPRNINTLCFNAMLVAFAEHAKSIDEDNLKEVARDMDLRSVLADLYHPEPAVAVSGGNGKVQPIRETELPETGTARTGVAEEPGADPGRISWEAKASVAAIRSGDGNTTDASDHIPPALVEAIARSDDIPPALVEAIARICLGLYEQQLLLAAKSVPSVEALPPAAPTPVSTGLASTRLDTTAAAVSETPASPGKASQPGEARPEQTVVSKTPVMYGYEAVAKKRSEYGSLWPKALSLAAITSILVFVLVESYSLQRPGGGQARAASLPASVQGDSAAGNSVHPEAPPSAIDAPVPSPKGPPVRSRGPRNLGSDGSQDVIIQKFPRDSNVGPEPSSEAQELTGIFFDEDSAVIGWQSRPSLQQIADALAVNPKADAVLEGHTDSSGPEAYNLDLSNRRAIAVRDVLVNEFHVSSTRLTVIGSGSAAPIRPNSTAAGRAYNRRVEVRLAGLNE